MEADIIGLKGTWESCNKFVNHDTGEVIRVHPYSNLHDEYNKYWPLECYIQLEIDDRFNTIKNVIPIE